MRYDKSMIFLCNGHRGCETAMRDMMKCDEFCQLEEDRKDVVCDIVGDLFEQALDDAVYRVLKCPSGKGICPLEFMDTIEKKELHYEYNVKYPDFEITMTIIF